MRIAFIKPPATYADWYKRPVLGISSIAAFLEQNGFECGIFDAYFNSWSTAELTSHIENYKPDIIGVTAMTHEIVQAAGIASELKKKLNIPAVIGGCHCTALPERTLSEFPMFDFGVHGEGEKTLLGLLRCLKQGKSEGLKSIQGLVFKSGEQIIVNPARPFLTTEELEALPYPAFHHYYDENRKSLAQKNSYYTIFTSRGCPFNCAFCMQVLGRRVRRRSAESVCREIEFAIDRYGAHTIDFADEIFLSDSRETRELLQLIIEKRLHRKIVWSGLTRANYVNSELIALAKKAGCVRLEMGVESGDDTILRTIGKGITVEQIKRAVTIIKEAKIPLNTYYILGHPNETRETLLKTVDLAVKLNTYGIAVGIMVPYPGTRIYDMALKGEGGYRLLSQDWSQYDKYGGKALEIEGLPYEELTKWQRRAFVNFYLNNFRLLDFLDYIWKRRKAIFFLFKKMITR